VGIVCDVGERRRAQDAPLDYAYSVYESLCRRVAYGVADVIVVVVVVVEASAGVAVAVAAAAVVAAVLRRCLLQTVF
jgi:hypothetical protein